uniref:Uncharacterized protein n=1 Tax=Rhizophora mucronata TaxID=61149 RepID=A0A2P2P1S3_RHIMU
MHQEPTLVVAKYKLAPLHKQNSNYQIMHQLLQVEFVAPLKRSARCGTCCLG